MREQCSILAYVWFKSLAEMWELSLGAHMGWIDGAR